MMVKVRVQDERLTARGGWRYSLFPDWVEPG